MSRFTIFAVIAALSLTIASAAVQSGALTSAAFNQPPGVAFDASSSTSADYTATTGWQTYTDIQYGPAATNTTVYAYGIKFVTPTLTSITTRSLNASLLSNGTAAKIGDAKIGSDATVSPGTTLIVTSTTKPVVGVGLGSIAVAYVAAVSSCNQVFVQIISAGASLVTKQVTSNTCVTCANSAATTPADGKSYDYLIGNVFYENSTYYVSYTQTLSTFTTAATCPTSASTYTTMTTLQGVAVSSSGDLKYTTLPTVYSQAAIATQAPTAAQIGVRCGPQNYTNSTNFYCVYKDGAAAGTANLKAVQIPVASGTAGAATTIATDVTASGSTYPQTSNAFTLAGFAYSLYQQGILISNATTVATSSTASTVTNTLQLYNLTTGATAAAGGVAISGISNTVSGGAYTAAGITYGTGFAILDQYLSSTTANTFEYSPYFANGTLNGTKTAVGSSGAQATGNWFADANGALWFGAWSYDDSASPYTATTGSVGKVVAQLYSAGNILASFFALLSVMIAAVFAF